MNTEIIVALIGFAGAVVPSLIGLLAKRSEGTRSGIPIGQWIFSCTIGAAIAGLLAGAIGQAVAGMGEIAPHLGAWAFFGAMIGAAQWRAMRAAGLSARLWVLASAIGWMPCALAFTQPWAWPVFGLFSALLQWLLNRGAVRQGITWIVTNTIAWFVAGNVSLMVGVALTPQVGFAVAWVVGWAVVGLVGGTITALVVRFALAAPKPAVAEG